ncbi:DUF2726 domain-containing protein [Morganella sp. EGD-HP17]|uniref:DUF2726 domain-containing protein n=1 Tax=Morganella sp. EGD-HP17 TaxID=1435146 RepID=UPI0004522C5E|nr:DUF2726 domain-containing protein [Morganella sp. EGD-HP17]ETO41242.1 hypothetical protein X965_11230 [Morganella sp. EGD-HP17]
MFYILGFVIVCILVCLYIVKMKSVIKEPNKNENGDKSKKNYSLQLMEKHNDCYVEKRFMTRSERDFFYALNKQIGDKNYIFPQVRVADILNPNKKYHPRSKEYNSLFKQISQWHCDYLVVKKENFTIEHAIELDDHTHTKENRINRDIIFNLAMKQAGISLLRVHDISDYNKKIQEQKKEEILVKSPESAELP